MIGAALLALTGVLLWWLWHHPLYIIGAMCALGPDFEHLVRWWMRWRTGREPPYWIHSRLFPEWALGWWGRVSTLAACILIVLTILL